MDSMMNCNYLRKILQERRFDESVESKNFIWFVGMNITQFLFWPIEIPPIRSTALPETLSEYVWYAEREVWKGTLMVADLEQVDKIDASEFHNVKLNAKEMISHKLVTIPKTADGQVKLLGGDQVLRTSTSIGGVRVPTTRRSSRRLSWRIRQVSTNQQSKKSLHINTVYTEIIDIFTKIASKNMWENLSWISSTSRLTPSITGKTNCYCGSRFINEFFLKLALFNIHDTFKTGNWSSYVFLKLVYLTNHDIFNCVKRQCG